jgi:hypothetical protein
LHALLDLPLRLEEAGGFRALIALDEFQDVGKVPSLDGILRSHIQFQGDVASYVFAGSEPGLMKQLFENKEAPLYGSAVPVRLGRLRDEDIAEYVAARFRQSKRKVGEALNPLLGSAKGHPQRAMLLAHRLWEEVERGGTATLEDWVTPRQSWVLTLREGTDFGRANNVEALLVFAAGEQTSSLSFRLDQLTSATDTGEELVLVLEERDGISKAARLTSNGLDVELFHILTYT